MRGMGMETPERAEDSLARIARALERIAAAEEERNRRKGRRIDVKAVLAEEEGERWSPCTSPWARCSAGSPGRSSPTSWRT